MPFALCLALVVILLCENVADALPDVDCVWQGALKKLEQVAAEVEAAKLLEAESCRTGMIMQLHTGH